jgi:hypothetical protein
MANWAKTFLLENDIDPARIAKRARHSLHLYTGTAGSKGRVGHFVGKPCHYLDGKEWREIDTALQEQAGGWLGAPGLPVRINATTKATEIIGSGYSQRTTRVGLYNPTSKAFSGLVNVPVGSVSGDCLIASGAKWQHILRLTEDGVREELMLTERPNIGAAKAGDWFVLETAILGADWADGEVSEVTVGGLRSHLPTAHDANGVQAPCKRLARRDGATLYLYTGVPVEWLAQAEYPVVVDPDFAGNTGDWAGQGDGSSLATTRTTCTQNWSTSAGNIGQYTSANYYWTYRVFLTFVTSAIGEDATVTQVNLAATPTTIAPTVNFDCQIGKLDWSGQDPVTSGNRSTAWNNVNSADSDDHIWINTASKSTNTQYTSGDLDTNWVVVAGTTYYCLRSDPDYAGTNPGWNKNNIIVVAMSDHTTSSYRPVLTVTYEEAASGPSNVKKFMGISKASIKKSHGVAIASIKKLGGVA